MPPYTLDTPRLHLRPMVQSDFDALLAIFTDPRVMASFDSPPLTPIQMQSWLQRNLDHQTRHGFGLFAVILKAEQRFIGNCGLEQMELDGQPETELGYDFHSDYWNQGYATEAASAVRDFAFHTLHLDRLISLIRAGNEASRHVAHKIGMREERKVIRNGAVYWIMSLDGSSSALSRSA